MHLQRHLTRSVFPHVQHLSRGMHQYVPDRQTETDRDRQTETHTHTHTDTHTCNKRALRQRLAACVATRSAHTRRADCTSLNPGLTSSAAARAHAEVLDEHTEALEERDNDTAPAPVEEGGAPRCCAISNRSCGPVCVCAQCRDCSLSSALCLHHVFMHAYIHTYTQGEATGDEDQVRRSRAAGRRVCGLLRRLLAPPPPPPPPPSPSLCPSRGGNGVRVVGHRGSRSRGNPRRSAAPPAWPPAC